MGLVTDEDGQIFCDWRFTVKGCTSSLFFTRLHFYSLVITLLLAFGFLTSILLRLRVLKEPWATFRKTSGSIILLTVLTLVFASQSGVVLFSGNEYAATILWSFMYPFCFAAPLFLLGIIISALPNLGSLHNQTHQAFWLDFISFKQKHLLLLFCFIYLTCLNVILFIIHGKLPHLQNLQLVALVLFSVNAFIFLGLYLLVAVRFLVLVKKGLEKHPSQLSREDQINREILALSMSKLKHNSFAIFTNGLILIIYHMLIAFYPPFFINLTLSKSLAIVTLGVLPTMLIPTVLLNLTLDFKKLISKRKFGASVSSSPNVKEISTPRESADPSKSANNQLEVYMKDLLEGKEGKEGELA